MSMPKVKKCTNKWLPLESNPDVMNRYLKNLGVTENFGISDVISLDEEFLDQMPTPSLALLLLFPFTDKYTKYCKTEELRIAKQEKVEDVYFIKQTIENACGTIALIHAVANNERILEFHPDSPLKEFLVKTKDLSPEDRGKKLEQDSDIARAHESSAQEGQTGILDDDETDALHFITFVNVNDQLVELDGRKSAPVLRGATNEKAFLKDAVRVCKEYMQREPNNLNFTALAFGKLT